VALVVGILLALFVLPTPWDYVAVGAGGVVELGEAALWWRWSHRRRSVVGPEALVGMVGEVTADGFVRVNGELWRARGAGPGERVRVRSVDGLTLDVEPDTSRSAS
jgi:membrane protein implicated in regulation of membrane protease activity